MDLELLASGEVEEVYRLGMVKRLKVLTNGLKNAQDDPSEIQDIYERIQNIAEFGVNLSEIIASLENEDDESEQTFQFKKELKKKREPRLPHEEEE